MERTDLEFNLEAARNAETLTMTMEEVDAFFNGDITLDDQYDFETSLDLAAGKVKEGATEAYIVVRITK